MKIIINIFKYLVISYLVLVSILFFVPKVNLYYFGEKILSEYQTKILGEEFHDNGLGFDINNLEMYYNDVFVSNIGSFSFVSYIFYTTIDINTIKVDQMLKKFSVVDMESIQITHSVVDPIHLNISVESGVGSVSGYVDIVQQSLHLVFTPNKKSKEYKGVLKHFKLINGEYVHERNF